MDDLIGLLAMIVVIGIILYILVVYVLPVLIGIGIAIAVVIGGWGLISGLAIASKNFVDVIGEAHSKLP